MSGLSRDDVLRMAYEHNLPSGSRDGETIAFARAVWNAACEEAGKAIEPRNEPDDWTDYAKTKAECAAAVRELKEEGK